MVKQYRKKPVKIEAVKWTGDNYSEIEEFTNDTSYLLRRCLFIKTLEGELIANTGDYIIKGVKGEFYPCKPDIFEKTYEEIK